MNKNQIVEKLGIKTVYWIDDQHTSNSDKTVEELIKEFSTVIDSASDKTTIVKNFKRWLDDFYTSDSQKIAIRSLVRKITHGGRVDIDGFEHELYNFFITHVASGDEQNKDNFSNYIAGQLPSPLTQDQKASVRNLFKYINGCDFHEKSFAEWNDGHFGIFAACKKSPGAAVLLIVDMQNTSNGGVVDGNTILSQWAKFIASEGFYKSVFVVVLTSTYDEKNEIIGGRLLTNQHFEQDKSKGGARHIPVTVISKSRLNSSPDGELENSLNTAFQQAFGRILVCKNHWALSDQVAVLFKESIAKSFADIEKLSVEELLITLSGKKIREEGASDIDTLIRIASTGQRKYLSEAISGRKELMDLLIDLRSLPDIISDFNIIDYPDQSGKIFELLSSEVVESSAIVNGLYSPLSNGDIFEFSFSGKKKYYVLIANACDIALRGGDKNPGTRKLDCAIMVSLLDSKGEGCKNGSSVAWNIRVPDFESLNGVKLVPDNNDFFAFPMDVLDLCWFYNDGQCRINSHAVIPRHLPTSQLERFEKLYGLFNKSNLGKANSGKYKLGKLKFGKPKRGKGNFLEDLKAKIYGVDVIAGSGGRIKFGVRRIGRVVDIYAHDLCDAFSKNMSRHSFEVKLHD